MNKVFVDNINYNCTIENFKEAFKNIKNIVDIQLSIDNNKCKGYGYIILKTQQDALNIINNCKFLLNGKKLRFLKYKENNNSNDPENINNNYICIRNLNNLITRKDIYKIFSKYSKIGKHFICTDILTGESQNYALVEILDDDKYNYLLMLKNIIDNNGDKLYIEKWKMEYLSIF